MKKDYYKILEIDKNASEEIIEKAYKTLAKKYHPDLQSEGNQKAYEEKLKEINEAYEVLSNTYRKSMYDEELKNSTVSQEDVQKVMDENRILKQQLQGQIQQQRYQQRVQQSEQRVYNTNQQANYNRNPIIFRHSLKYYLKLASIILGLILILILLYQIPFIKNWCNTLYNENLLIKVLVDSFVQTFKSTF